MVSPTSAPLRCSPANRSPRTEFCLGDPPGRSSSSENFARHFRGSVGLSILYPCEGRPHPRCSEEIVMPSRMLLALLMFAGAAVISGTGLTQDKAQSPSPEKKLTIEQLIER